MTSPKKNDPFKDLIEINKEVLSFDFKKSRDEQQEEVKRISQKVVELINELPIGTIAEVGGDSVSIFSCAIKPVDIVACLWAIVAVIDIIKVAREKKLK